jgi:RNA recognition motif-containing protein
MDIYVGNLAYSLSEQDLRAAFEEFGEVGNVKIVMDRDTGRSKGFAFVDMPDSAQGQAAIDSLNGREMAGRALTVNQARPRESGGGGGGGRGFGGGGGGGRGFGGGAGGGGGRGGRGGGGGGYGGGGGRDRGGY